MSTVSGFSKASSTEKRKAKFRRYEANDLCVASGSVSSICQIFIEHQKHPLAPHMIFLVYGCIDIAPRFAGSKETVFKLIDSTGIILCHYFAIDIDIPEDVQSGTTVRCMGRLIQPHDSDQPTMQVIKVRLALSAELEKNGQFLC